MPRRRSRKLSRWGIGWAALVLVVGGGCGSLARPTVEPSVAVFDGGEITQDQYRDWLSAKNKKADTQRLREDLERMVVTLSLAEAAVREGLSSDPVAGLIVRRAEDGVLARALQSIQAEGIKFTEEELRQAFEGRPENLHRPKKYRLHELFLRLGPGASEELETQRRDEAEALRERLVAGEDIDALAREFSDSQTRLQGGYVGVVDPAQLAPAVGEAVRRLEEGAVTPVLRVSDGFLVLSCDFIVEERRHTFEESRETVCSILEKREARRRWTRLQEELLDEADARYDFRAIRDPGTPADRIVVRFRGGELSYSQALALIHSASGLKGDLSRWPENRLREMLDAFVVRWMAARRARELGLDHGPGIGARMRWARLEALSLQELARRVSLRMTPSGPEAIHREIEGNPSRYRHPAEFLLSAIRLDGEAETLRERWAEAGRLVDGLRFGDLDFEETARRLSAHPSAAEGGDLGWRNRLQLGVLGASVAASVEEMAPGEIRGPVQERTTLWILHLRDRRGPRPMESAEAVPMAKRRLDNARARSLQLEIEAEVVEGLRIVR